MRRSLTFFLAAGLLFLVAAFLAGLGLDAALGLLFLAVDFFAAAAGAGVGDFFLAAGFGFLADFLAGVGTEVTAGAEAFAFSAAFFWAVVSFLAGASGAGAAAAFVLVAAMATEGPTNGRVEGTWAVNRPSERAIGAMMEGICCGAVDRGRVVEVGGMF